MTSFKYMWSFFTKQVANENVNNRTFKIKWKVAISEIYLYGSSRYIFIDQNGLTQNGNFSKRKKGKNTRKYKYLVLTNYLQNIEGTFQKQYIVGGKSWRRKVHIQVESRFKLETVKQRYTCFSLVNALIIFHRSGFGFMQSHWLRNFFLHVKDTRDVPQFNVISHERVFRIYLYLNLLMPKRLRYKILSFLELEYFVFSWNAKYNIMLKNKVIVYIFPIYPNRKISYTMT